MIRGGSLGFGKLFSRNERLWLEATGVEHPIEVPEIFKPIGFEGGSGGIIGLVLERGLDWYVPITESLDDVTNQPGMTPRSLDADSVSRIHLSDDRKSVMKVEFRFNRYEYDFRGRMKVVGSWVDATELIRPVNYLLQNQGYIYLRHPDDEDLLEVHPVLKISEDSKGFDFVVSLYDIANGKSEVRMHKIHQLTYLLPVNNLWKEELDKRVRHGHLGSLGRGKLSRYGNPVHVVYHSERYFLIDSLGRSLIENGISDDSLKPYRKSSTTRFVRKFSPLGCIKAVLRGLSGMRNLRQ